MKTIALTVLILFTATACYAQRDMELSITVPEGKIGRAKLIVAECPPPSPTSTPCSVTSQLEDLLLDKLRDLLRRFDNTNVHRKAGKDAEKASRDSITDYDEIFQ